jgi:hypothetical protein
MLVLVHYQALFEQFTGAPNNNLVLGIAYGCRRALCAGAELCARAARC